MYVKKKKQSKNRKNAFIFILFYGLEKLKKERTLNSFPSTNGAISKGTEALETI